MSEIIAIVVILPFFMLSLLLMFLGRAVGAQMPRMQNLVRASFVVWLFAEGVHRVVEGLGWYVPVVEYFAAIASIGVMVETVRYVRWFPKVLEKSIREDAEDGRTD